MRQPEVSDGSPWFATLGTVEGGFDVVGLRPSARNRRASAAANSCTHRFSACRGCSAEEVRSLRFPCTRVVHRRRDSGVLHVGRTLPRSFLSSSRGPGKGQRGLCVREKYVLQVQRRLCAAQPPAAGARFGVASGALRLY
eukprot:scaffold7267_cov395-Prasinococcus_capsulatus_cf.AAC.1